MYKAEHVRFCPHCGLQCLRTDGCDSVTCGRDAEDKGHKIQYGKGCVWLFGDGLGRCLCLSQLALIDTQLYEEI